MDEKKGKEPSVKSDRDQEEMLEEELELVAGGMNSIAIQACKVCERRVAVSGMSVCAACFRVQNPLEEDQF